MFMCERCGYAASYKCNMKSHYNRKWPCKPLKSNSSFETLKDKFNRKSPKCKPNVNIHNSECKHNVNTI